VDTKLIVSEHAIERYRKHNKTDPLRYDRETRHVEGMIREGILTHKFWPILEKISLESMNYFKVCTNLEIKISDLNGYRGRCRVAINSNACARGYVVSTTLPL
jgi:hypothetical protein